MTKFREHRATLLDAFARVELCQSRRDLIAICKRMFPELLDAQINALEVKPYGGIDERTGWDTYIVTIPGFGVVGYTDGPEDGPQRGLGDTIAWLTKKLGIKECQPCGERRRKLNERVPYRRNVEGDNHGSSRSSRPETLE